MMYYRLIAYISITNEPIFKNLILSDCRKAKLYFKMLAVVLRPISSCRKKDR